MDGNMPEIGFEQVVGQKLAVSHLQNALKTGRISQAYLICGEKGAGKEKLATAFAASLLCEHPVEKNGYPEPCGTCHSCRQMQSGSHPDFVTATNEWAEVSTKTGTLGVALARRVQSDAQIRPYQGPYKIYVIPQADRLNPQAQNALLKTLEEPPAYAVFLLLAQNLSVFLPTVLSRCVLLPLHPAPEKDLVEMLQKQGTGEEEAVIAARLSHGNPGRSQELIGEELLEFRRKLTDFLERISDKDSYEILKFSEYLAGGGEDNPSHMEDFLDMGRSWYRDILTWKSTQSVDNLIFKDKVKYIISAAKQFPFAKLSGILEAFGEAERRKSSKENDTQIAELLLLKIRGILRRPT